MALISTVPGSPYRRTGRWRRSPGPNAPGLPPGGTPTVWQVACYRVGGRVRRASVPTAIHLTGDRTHGGEKGDTMLWTIFVILLILWALGMVSSYTLGGFIHILLVIAIVVLLIRVIQGRRVL